MRFRAIWAVGFAVLGFWLLGCPADEQVHEGPPEDASVEPDAGSTAADAGGFDAGLDAGVDAGVDAGAEDAGTPDAGYDAGVIDAGEPDAGVVVELPTLDGWTFYGVQNGGPRRVNSVTSDAKGNLWVAGGSEGLFLLQPGETTFRRFTIADGLTPFVDSNGPQQQEALSVEGGPANTVFVGYRGHHGGLQMNDPPYLLKSGDADKVVWDGAAITVTHLDISTPPGDLNYPNGRDLIRDVLRMQYDPATGDLWIGGNHGVAIWHGTYKIIQEHQHAAINGYTASGQYTLLSGDWYGIALAPSGDFWFGGGHRLAKINFSARRRFWDPVDPIIDVWPDPVPADAQPNQRVDDFVQDLAVSSNGAVWVGSIPNGLAVVAPDGTISTFDKGRFVDPKITALEVDPSDGSLWVGHIWGGLTRLSGGQYVPYSEALFGPGVISQDVPDIQSDRLSGQRRILVAFGSGIVGIYTGK